MKLTFQAIDESEPGPKWAAAFERFWPGYRRWWLSHGEASRPTYLECRKALRTHMPDFVPTYERLVELAGGSDHAARFLSGWCPPPYLAGCSQAVWPGVEPLLVRNYDYNPDTFDATVLGTEWQGRRVIGMSDCMIGLLDGMNEDGLVVSLTFGGRREIGTGFGIPLVLRYVLEMCVTTEQAVRVLERVPCHMAYNVTVLDGTGTFRTVYLGPGRRAVVTDAGAATNHQHAVEWHEHAQATASVEREAFLLKRLEKLGGPARRFVAAFQRPPLYSHNFSRGFGTLYTAVYRPGRRSLELRWAHVRWTLPLNGFKEESREIAYRAAGG